MPVELSRFSSVIPIFSWKNAVFEITSFVSGVGLAPFGGCSESSNKRVDSGGEFLDRLGDS